MQINSALEEKALAELKEIKRKNSFSEEEKETFLEKGTFDQEVMEDDIAHEKADKVLTDLLIALGYGKVVEIYEQTPELKHYY